MRKMKKFNDSVVSWYLQWSVLSTSAIIMLATGLPFAEFGTWDWQSWTLAFLCGSSQVFSETARFKALKLQKASALQKLIPLTTLFQFLFDITLFRNDVSYSMWQLIALGYLTMLYVVIGLKFLVIDSKKAKQKEKAKEMRQSLASIASVNKSLKESSLRATEVPVKKLSLIESADEDGDSVKEPA